jgi:hypothetical protein
MIRTTRLSLLPIQYADLTRGVPEGAALFVSLYQLTADPWPVSLATPEQLRCLHSSTSGPAVLPHWGLYLITRPHWYGPSDLVGLGALLGPPDAQGKVSISATVLPPFHHKGLRLEAEAGLRSCALCRQEVTAVRARPLPTVEVVPDERYLRRVRFTHEGTNAPRYVRT